MSNPSLVIVVVEDDHHRMLVYRYLGELGMEAHKIRILRSPSAKGSAEKWVKTRFAQEANLYRRRQAVARTALIVAIDADTHSVEDRLRQLDQALRDNGRHPVNIHREQIARLVPKRNVETWILCLNGTAVDEKTDYKKTRSNWNELIPPAAKSLHQWTQSKKKPPKHCVASLRHGIQELQRLRF